MSILVAKGVYAAGLTATSGTDLRNIILGIIGTFLIVVLAARGLAAFADERYGKLASLVIAAVPVAGFCYFPDGVIEMLKGLFSSFTGAG